jgi:diguanylate cyclase (GGDEF)-like protein
VTSRRGPASSSWLDRFGRDVPTLAHVLLDGVHAAVADPRALDEVREGAEALGALRAQQGHAVAGLVEDLLALRDLLPRDVPHMHDVVDATLRLATSAYVEELTALLATQATRDPLTGLPNRAAFNEAMLHEIASTARAGAPSLVLVDLDKFKLVNDTDGHLAGDAVLLAVADLLRTNLRTSDLACRLGGDEFALVLPRTSAAKALTTCRRLLKAARKEAGLSSPGARVTLSMGIGWLPEPGDVAELVALADRHLYDVKASGGDDVRLPDTADLVPA